MESEKGSGMKERWRLKYEGRWVWTIVDKVRGGIIMNQSER